MRTAELVATTNFSLCGISQHPRAESISPWGRDEEGPCFRSILDRRVFLSILHRRGLRVLQLDDESVSQTARRGRDPMDEFKTLFGAGDGNPRFPIRSNPRFAFKTGVLRRTKMRVPPT